MNRELGRRIARRRAELGLTAAHVDAALMLPRGTLGRMERGDKGLDAALLISLAQILDVPVSFFFDNLPPAHEYPRPALPSATMIDETAAFLDQFHSIDNEAERRQILALLRSVAGAED